MTHAFADLIFDWNEPTADRTRRVEVLDDTLRDGLQSPSARDPGIDEKKDLIRLAGRLGVDGVVLGLPGAGRRACEEIAALASFIDEAGLDLVPVTGVRTHPADIDAHLAACDRSGRAITAGMFLGSSPIRLVAEDWKLADLVELTVASVKACVAHGVPVMFITEDSTRSPPATLRDLYLAALDAGASRICLADTVGHAEPSGVVQLVRFAKALIEQGGFAAAIDWHGHNDRGLALVNALVAAEAGADRIHATGLGLGERSGNTALDQLIVNLALKGQAPHRALEALPDYCRKVRDWCGAPLPPNYPVVGEDAFRTATGVHAAAITKALARGDDWIADRVYSSVPASMVGRAQHIEIGFMSGKSNVQHWLSRHRPGLDETHRNACIESVLAVAKERRELLADDTVASIVAATLERPVGAAQREH